MNCNDCIHFEVCYYVDQTMTQEEIEAEGAENDCRHFISAADMNTNNEIEFDYNAEDVKND